MARRLRFPVAGFRRTHTAQGDGGAASTAAVLWLMILLVFLPIALAHGAARLLEDGAHAAAPATP